MATEKDLEHHYAVLKKLAKWKCDGREEPFIGADMVDQDVLFDMQEYLGAELLKAAQKIGKEDDLVKTFPWLFKKTVVK